MNEDDSLLTKSLATKSRLESAAIFAKGLLAYEHNGWTRK